MYFVYCETTFKNYDFTNFLPTASILIFSSNLHIMVNTTRSDRGSVDESNVQVRKISVTK